MVVTEGTSIILSNNQATSSMISAVMAPANTLAMSNIIMGTLAFIFLIVIVVGWWGTITYVRKSKDYRKKMTDMYVVGVVKKLAKNDGIDIEEELEKFDKDCMDEKKKSKRDSEELDNTIESNLQEEVDAHTEQKLKEIKRKI